MSDDNKIPGPPPDDFTKTTPNVNIPDQEGPAGWDNTRYNVPRPVPSTDDWGKTVANIKPLNTDHPDYGKTMYPGAGGVPEADWGLTQANIKVNESDFGMVPEDYGGEHVADKTTPYFRLPEAERAKYEKLPATPAEQAEQEKREKRAQGGIPGWVWAAAGLMSMFFFAVAVLLVVYFFILPGSGYEITVRAPVGSDIYVDDISWSVTSEDGSYRLPNLQGGRRIIKAVHPTQDCEPFPIELKGSGNPPPIILRCKDKPVQAGEDCSNIPPGNVELAERCYLEALNKVQSLDDLIRALNLLVVNFASDSYEVPKERLNALQRGAEYIKKVPPGVVLEVGGHTDNQGPAGYNQTLSENRAKAVKERLVQFGVPDGTLQTRGYGLSKPIADNNTNEGRYRNRRIEYSIVKRQ